MSSLFSKSDHKLVSSFSRLRRHVPENMSLVRHIVLCMKMSIYLSEKNPVIIICWHWGRGLRRDILDFCTCQMKQLWLLSSRLCDVFNFDVTEYSYNLFQRFHRSATCEAEPAKSKRGKARPAVFVSADYVFYTSIFFGVIFLHVVFLYN